MLLYIHRPWLHYKLCHLKWLMCPGQPRKLQSRQISGKDCGFGVLKVAEWEKLGAFAIPPMVGSCLLGGFEDVPIRKGQHSGKWYMLPQCGQGHRSGWVLGMGMQSIHVSRWRTSRGVAGCKSAKFNAICHPRVQKEREIKQSNDTLIAKKFQCSWRFGRKNSARATTTPEFQKILYMDIML